MADTDTGAPAPAATYRAPPIVILAQYLKDLSFESPNSPQILSQALDVRQGRVGVDLRITPMGPPNWTRSPAYLMPISNALRAVPSAAAAMPTRP